MTKILVLNLGMKSIRSIIFDDEGNKLASSSVPITTALEDDRVTQNPNEWWDKGCKVISDTLDIVPKEEIDYLTVTASAACLIPVDENCNTLYQCMMVSDKRAKKESDYIAAQSEYDSIRQATGLDMDAHLMLPKALWIKRNKPEIYEKTYKFLTPNDFLIGKLTDEIVATDYINAAKWHYDTEKDTYPEKMLEQIGIDKTKLPEVVSPGSFIGCISEKASRETGLSKKTKVIISSYDAISSFIGSGISEEGEACDISGTVTVFRTAAAKKTEGKLYGIQQIPYKEAGLYILGGSNNMGGSLIEWVRQCYYMNEELPYELMEKDAREAGAGAGGLIFLPYLLGERAPIWDHEARGVFFGLERVHTRKEMTRAVFESTGFIDLDMMKAIEQSGGRVDKIRLSGGLARVGLVSQIKADVTGKDIEVLDEFETTASGAAMMALFGQGIFSSIKEAGKAFARIRMVIKPNPKAHEKYLKQYGLYKDTYETLKPLFHKRSGMIREIVGDKKIKIENL